MTNQSKIVATVTAAFVVGLAAPTLVIWNPLDWAWADSVVGREHSHESAVQTEQERCTRP